MLETPPISVEPRHWRVVQDILRRCVPGYEVWAFGSRARGQHKPYSDLDLAIITRAPLPLPLLAELEEAFSESDLPWRVDVLDWASTEPSFRAIVERDKVIVQQP